MRTIRKKKVLPDGSVRITEYVYPTGYKGKSTTANSISKKVYTIPAYDVTVSAAPRTVAAARSGSRPDLVGPVKKNPSKTYITKSGEIREYYYEKGKSHRGRTFVGSNGRIYHKNVETYKSEIDASQDLNEAQKRAAKADLEELVKTRSKKGQRLTETGFEGTQAANEITRFFANAGQSSKEAAADIGVSESALLNPQNWDGLHFKYEDQNGRQFDYQFHWGYYGKIWKRVVS